ncbi:unnamed protein product, partial [Allacma fusca]
MSSLTIECIFGVLMKGVYLSLNIKAFKVLIVSAKFDANEKGTLRQFCTLINEIPRQRQLQSVQGLPEPTCVTPSPTLETAEMNTRAISAEAPKAPEPIQRRITNEPDITWKARKRSRVLDIDVSEAGITLNLITGAVQPLANDSTRLELFYSCQHCSFCSYDTSKFKDHIFSRSPGTLFQCHLCTFKSCTPTGMRIHMGKIHSSLRINAEVVPKSVVQTIAVIAEAPEAETPPVAVQKSYLSIPKAKSGYQCSHCQKKFWKKVQFQHHLRTHTRERSF